MPPRAGGFDPRSTRGGISGWRDGFHDGDEVVMRLHPWERCLDVAVLRAGGAVRCCAYRLPLPPPVMVVDGGGKAPGGVVGTGGEGGREDRWFFCCYLSNGVGIDVIPTTPEEVGVGVVV
jgi:hypothetical protein